MSTGTTSAEDALAKAKQVAAELGGDATSPDATGASSAAKPSRAGTGTKRKRWGVASDVAPAITPAAAPAATEALPGLASASKRLKDANQPISRRFWVTTSENRTEYHYFMYLPKRLEDVKKQVGKDAEGKGVKIVLKGRGAKGTAPLPGVPEEPMNVVVEGSPDLLTKADELVDALLKEAEAAPLAAEGGLPPPPGAVPVETANPSSALTVQASYRPASVAQMIAGTNNPLGNVDPSQLIEDKIHVPNGVVGFVIGRGGENITSLQARTGCKVQIQKEHELSHGQTQRVITLLAPTQAAIDECRELINDMVKDRVRTSGGGGGPGGASHKGKLLDAMASGHAVVTLDIPDADVGLVIGKGGSTIKMIQDTTGSSIQIPPSGNIGNPSMRTVNITNPNEEGAQAAKREIETLLANKQSQGPRQHHQHLNQGSQLTMQVMIPDKDVGLCIGRQGCVIKEMQRKSNTRIQIPPHPAPGQMHRLATVSGSKEGIDMVKGMIDRIVAEQSSSSVTAGTGHGAPFNQRHQAGGHYQHRTSQYTPHTNHYGNGPMGGQPHHQQPHQQNQNAHQWQGYHGGQQQQHGGHGMAPGQAVAQQAAAPAPPAQTTNQYHEQFFRYMYYYGEEAARKYFGAWSPVPGTPNPYGVNPQGITAPPSSPGTQGQGAAPGTGATLTSASAHVPPQAAQASPAAAAAPPARDSSVRKVSNLPAWMTQQS